MPVVFLIIFLPMIVFIILFQKEETISTEDFIEAWLKNNNGTLATYMQDTALVDEDLVKGREALSESLGLWMAYALEKEDPSLFEEAYHILTTYFMDERSFIYWKLTETGHGEVYANALIDDLRIVGTLYEASEKWNNTTYKETAEEIGQFVVKHNVYQEALIDFYEKDYQGKSTILTLSYIDPSVLTLLLNEQLLPKYVYVNMMDILENAPISNSFYSTAYNIETEQYQTDETINMIDQVFIALSLSQRDVSTEPFNKFVKNELEINGAVYGRYERETEEAIEKYESPAVYGLLVMYYLELDDIIAAEEIYEKMNKLKRKHGKYNGGYAIYHENTHIFDNVVPLLAERKLANAGVIELK